MNEISIYSRKSIRSLENLPVKHDISAGIVENHGRFTGDMNGTYILPKDDCTMNERFGKVDE
ncbi:MAG: hypothetical protein ACP5NK_03225 [Thermoplasmata archaeon]